MIIEAEDKNYTILEFNDLQALSIEFHFGQTDSLDQHYLLIDLATPCPTALEAEQIGHWLEQQAMPIIGYSPSDTNALTPFADVVVSSVPEVGRLTNQINAYPISSTVLVQVLRVTSQMSIQEALTVESLAFSTLQSGREFAAWLEQYRDNHPNLSPAPVSHDEPPVLLTHHGEDLAIVLNRPKNHNAFSAEMRDALYDAFQLVALDKTIKNARVSGRGQYFCTGGDLAEFGQFGNAADAHLVRTLKLPSRILAGIPERFEFHLHRACIGSGIEIPAFAQKVTAHPETYFQLPEISMGLIPGAGGCVSIPRRIGRQRTGWLALSGEKINAYTALEWGLIDAIID
ncbi:MAG: enoyl-CoA hydratase/carnithine racemase [Candidatus Azotimanducaceae bacterium]|jgi:enoyl-CoA hydratase/carnithine racemase